MDKKVNAVSEALAALNRALSEIASAGIEANVSVSEARRISEPSAFKVVTIHLTKVKTEIDIHL